MVLGGYGHAASKTDPRTIAVTPMKLKTLPWEDTVKISKDWAISAIQTVASLPHKEGQPLRFIYMSGHFAPRERTEQIKVLGDLNMTEYGYLRVSRPPPPSPLAAPFLPAHHAKLLGARRQLSHLMHPLEWLTVAPTTPGRGRSPHPSVRRGFQGPGPVVRHQVRLHQRPRQGEAQRPRPAPGRAAGHRGGHAGPGGQRV